MAKALGKSPEEERKEGLYKLAQVRHCYSQTSALLIYYLATTWPSRPFLHGFATIRGHRMVRRLPQA